MFLSQLSILFPWSMGLSLGQSLCPLHVPVPPSIPFSWSMGLSHGLSSVFLACSCPNYQSTSLDPWDCPMDCLLCPLHVAVPTIHPLPLIHGMSHGLSSVSLACSCPNYSSPSLDPWDCPMDCLLCPLNVPVPTIHSLIVPWTVLYVPWMFLSHMSLECCYSTYPFPSLDLWDCPMDWSMALSKIRFSEQSGKNSSSLKAYYWEVKSRGGHFKGGNPIVETLVSTIVHSSCIVLHHISLSKCHYLNYYFLKSM